MSKSTRFARLLALSGLTACLASGLAFAQLSGQAPQTNPAAQDLSLPESASRFQPLHVAALKGDVLAIQDELDKGVDVNLRVERGFFSGATPLMLAARDADAATMLYLIERGGDATARDDARRSVLMWAASTEGTVEKINIALQHGAKPDPRSQDGATALHWAAGLGHDPDMVKVLIDAGASIDLVDDRGRTPLMTAARVGNAGATRHLLAGGADRSRKSPQGLNAVHWASEGAEGNAETLGVLLDAGMALESRAADGSTPLIIASLNGRTPQIIELLARGADVDAINSWGLTPLMAASSNGSPDAVKALLDANPDVDAQDQAGRVALHYSVAKGNGIVTAMLARRNPNPNIADNEGWMPIHMARTMSTLDPLVRLGADLNARCGVTQYHDWTPLMFATASGNAFMVRCLVNADADPMIQTEEQLNAMRIALALEYADGSNPIADILREAVAKKQATQEAEALRERREQRLNPDSTP